MSVIRDKYVLEADIDSSGAFRGTANQVEALTRAFEDMGTRGGQALERLRPSDASQKAINRAVASLRELKVIETSLAASSVNLDTGRSVANLQDLEASLKSVRASFTALHREMAGRMTDANLMTSIQRGASSLWSPATVARKMTEWNLDGTTQARDDLQRAFVEVMNQQAIGADRKGTSTRALQELRNRVAQNVGGQQNLGELEGRVAQRADVTAKSIEASGKAMDTTLPKITARARAQETLLRTTDYYNLGMAEQKRAVSDLTKIFSDASLTDAQRAQRAREVTAALRAQLDTTSRLGTAQKAASAGVQTALRTGLSANLNGQVRNGGLSNTEAAQVRDAVNKDIAKGVVRTYAEVNAAVATHTRLIRGLAAANNNSSGITLRALHEESRDRLIITEFLERESRLLGLNVRLRGQLKGVIEGITHDLIKNRTALQGNETAITDLLATRAALKQAETRATPQGLNDFGISFAAGFASQAIFSGLRTLINSMSQYEDGLITVRRTTGATEQQTKDLSSALLDLGKTTPIAMSEMLKASAALGQVGALELGKTANSAQAIADARKAIQLVSETALVADMSAETAATSYGQFKQVFSADMARYTEALKALGVQGVTTADAMRVLFGAINETAQSTAATTPELLDFMGQFGGIAASLGIQAEKVVAFGGAVRDLQVGANVAGTAMVRFFSRASADADQFAKILGVSETIFRAEFSAAPLETLLKVFQKLKDTSKENNLAFQDFANKLHLESREKNAISKLVENSEFLQESLSRTNDTAKLYRSVSEEAQTRSETWSAKVALLSNAFTRLTQEMSPVMEMAKTLIGAVTSVISFLAGSETAVWVSTIAVAAAATAGVALAVLKIRSMWILATQALNVYTARAREAQDLQNYRNGLPLTAGPTTGRTTASVLAVGAAVAAGLTAANTLVKSGGEEWGVALMEGLLGGVALALPSLLPRIVALLSGPAVLGALTPLWTSLATSLAAAGAALVAAPVAAIAGAAMVATGVAVVAATADARASARESKAAADAAQARYDALKAASKKASENVAGYTMEVQRFVERTVSTVKTAEGLSSAWASVASSVAAASDEAAEFRMNNEKALEAFSKADKVDPKFLAAINHLTSSAMKDAAAARGLRLEAENELLSQLDKAGFGASSGKIGESIRDRASKAIKDTEERIKTLKGLSLKQAKTVGDLSVAFNSASGTVAGTSRDDQRKTYLSDALKTAQEDLQITKDTIERQKGLARGLQAAMEAVTKTAEAEVATQDNVAKTAAALTEKARKLIESGGAALRQEMDAILRDAAEKPQDAVEAKLTEVVDKYAGLVKRTLESIKKNAPQASQEAIRDTLNRVMGTFGTQDNKYSEALRARLSALYSDASNQIDQSIEADKRLTRTSQQGARDRIALKKAEIQAAQDELVEVKEKVDLYTKVRENLKSMNLLKLGNVRSEFKGLFETTNDSTLKVESFSNTARDALGAMVNLVGLGSDKFKALEAAISKAGDSLSKYLKQQALSSGVKAGEDLFSTADTQKKSSLFLNNNSGASSLVRDVNALLAQSPGREAEAGVAIGRLLGAYKDRATKSGLADTEGYKAFIKDFEDKLGSVLKAEGPKDAASAVREVGEKTNSLLAEILAVSKVGRTGEELAGRRLGAASVTDVSSGRVATDITQAYIIQLTKELRGLNEKGLDQQLAEASRRGDALQQRFYEGTSALNEKIKNPNATLTQADATVLQQIIKDLKLKIEMPGTLSMREWQEKIGTEQRRILDDALANYSKDFSTTVSREAVAAYGTSLNALVSGLTQDTAANIKTVKDLTVRFDALKATLDASRNYTPSPAPVNPQ